MYDTAVILSMDREFDGSLGPEFIARIDLGIEYYKAGFVSSLTMCGNHGRTDAHLTASHADDMRSYAIKKGIPKKDIFIEHNSLDTVGQAVFTNERVINPNDMGSVIIISSDYHIARVIIIFDFVLGDKIRKIYSSIGTKLISDSKICDSEEKNIRAFSKTFEGVERGNLEAIQERLFERHPLYVGKRKEFGGI